MSETVDRPEYSSTMIAMSAVAEGLAVTVSALPPGGTGAVQMLIWVPSDAVKFVTSTKVSLSESVTELAVPLFEFQTPTSTTRRSPVATLAPVVTAMLLFDDPCALACWTNAGPVAARAAGAVASTTVPPASRAIA